MKVVFVSYSDLLWISPHLELRISPHLKVPKMNFKTSFNASLSADWLPLTSRRFEQHVGGGFCA